MQLINIIIIIIIIIIIVKYTAREIYLSTRLQGVTS